MALQACVPDLGSTDAVVTAQRILAVRANPPDAKPGASVTFTALVASPDGTVKAPSIAWSFCDAPKALTEDNIVSNACFDASSLAGVGSGDQVTATMPANACSLFGPDSPATGLRPRDPDPTGGYYQPLYADLSGVQPAFALVRVRCDLANASSTAAAAFAKAYLPNKNPTLLPLIASVDGARVSFAAVRSGSHVDLTASWASASAETYAYYDPAADAVVTKREAMSVAWYASGGTLKDESTGRAEGDLETTSENTWTAPTAAGAAHLWVVLRDSRGGVDFATVDATVGP